MNTYQVTFINGTNGQINQISVPEGTLLSSAARQAGVEFAVPCGGQGRCGRCAVQITIGGVQQRSSLRLSVQDIAQGFTLGCQSLVDSDISVVVPPQDKLERRLVTNRSVTTISPPANFDCPIKRISLSLTPPSLDNQIDDWSRFKIAFHLKTGIDNLSTSLDILRQLGPVLREGDWTVTAIYEDHSIKPDSVMDNHANKNSARLLALSPVLKPESGPIWGVAIDIGTTTVTIWLVDLITGQIKAEAAEYNGQISRGDDVISRIIYASRNADCQQEMRTLVLQTIGSLVNLCCQEVGIVPNEIMRATVAGNSTMIHLFLGIPASSIRLSPFITAVNHFPLLTAKEAGLSFLNPEASVDCLPGVASYVGSDITAGVLACELDWADDTSLFMDIGTNGETVLGCREWMITCACSAGPAFEGAGVEHGMRATAGAIEEVWINQETLEPTYRTIGGLKPRGLCGSGLISLLSELFITGLVDKAGKFNRGMPTKRLREGDHGPEYVVAWGTETFNGQDLWISHVDINNILRTKAAIYAGFDVLADRVGLTLDGIPKVIIGGSFGRYINVETAIRIGLLPDIPWEQFKFLGNTSVRGAYLALIDQPSRMRLDQIAAKMTYVELSADNAFYNAFISALFLPHTDITRFPSVGTLIQTQIQDKQ